MDDKRTPRLPFSGEARAGRPGSLDLAVSRAVDFLMDRRHPDGYWIGFLENDTGSTGLYILLCHYLGCGGTERTRKALRHLIRTRNREGGWFQVPGGPSHLDTTLVNYLALALEGVPEEDAWMTRSRDLVAGLGGLERIHFFSKLVLGFFGVFPFAHLPWVTARLIENRGFIYRQGFARTIFVPYMALYEMKAVRDLSGRVPLAVQAWGRPGAGTLEDAFRRLLGGFSLFRDPVLSPFHLERCLEWIAERQEADGTWGGVFQVTFFSLMALHADMEERWEALIRRGIDGVHGYQKETGGEIVQQFSVSPVMDTAYAVRALLQAGVPGDSPQIRSSADWLASRQICGPGDWKENNPDGEPGGWSFEFCNTRYPDLDSTSMVLNAFTFLPERTLEAYLPGIVDRGLNWVLGMQNWDGGFAVWDKNNWPFLRVLSVLLDVGDYSHADVTARVLMTLARLSRLDRYGNRPDLRRGIRLATRFLWSRQERFSCWYGRWGVNYAYGTAQVLEAMGTRGIRASHLLVRPVLHWVEGAQNPDGGWGESVLSYETGRFVPGPSTAVQTAIVLLGLLAVGAPQEDVLERGLRFLLASQGPDGGWADTAFFATNIPRVWYGRYELLPTEMAVMALCTWRACH